MVKKKPEKETKKCRHCGSEITPCPSGKSICFGKGWVHTENQMHRCDINVKFAEPETTTVD